jgi:hypothetical protein
MAVLECWTWLVLVVPIYNAFQSCDVATEITVDAVGLSTWQQRRSQEVSSATLWIYATPHVHKFDVCFVQTCPSAMSRKHASWRRGHDSTRIHPCLNRPERHDCAAKPLLANMVILIKNIIQLIRDSGITHRQYLKERVVFQVLTPTYSSIPENQHDAGWLERWLYPHLIKV